MFKARLERAKLDYSALCKAGLKIDMTRGKPRDAQIALSYALLTLPGNGDFFLADGGDARNYFGSVQGLPEARALFSRMMGRLPERIPSATTPAWRSCTIASSTRCSRACRAAAAPWSCRSRSRFSALRRATTATSRSARSTASAWSPSH